MEMLYFGILLKLKHEFRIKKRIEKKKTRTISQFLKEIIFLKIWYMMLDY